MKTITYENLATVLFDKIIEEHINPIDTEELVEKFQTFLHKVINSEYDNLTEDKFDRDTEIYCDLASLICDHSENAFRIGMQTAFELFFHGENHSEVSEV